MHLSIGHAIFGPDHTYDRQATFPYWTLSMSMGGRFCFRAEGREMELESPRLSLIASCAPYHVHRIGPGLSENYWALFEMRREWEQWTHWPPRSELSDRFLDLTLRDPAIVRQMLSAFRNAYEVWHSASPQREALAANAVERILILADTINPSAAHARVDERVRQVMNYMVSHLREAHTIDSLASLVHVSPSHLAHTFREQVGQSPIAWLESQRMARARELLVSTNDSISEVAEAVGIHNAYYFSTRFKKQEGRSPSAYRRSPGG